MSGIRVTATHTNGDTVHGWMSSVGAGYMYNEKGLNTLHAYLYEDDWVVKEVEKTNADIIEDLAAGTVFKLSDEDTVWVRVPKGAVATDDGYLIKNLVNFNGSGTVQFIYNTEDE